MDRLSLNVSQTADLLGVSADTVRRLADTGHLLCYRLPSGYRRFEASDVRAFGNALRQTRRSQVEQGTAVPQ